MIPFKFIITVQKISEIKRIYTHATAHLPLGDLSMRSHLSVWKPLPWDSGVKTGILSEAGLAHPCPVALRKAEAGRSKFEASLGNLVISWNRLSACKETGDKSSIPSTGGKTAGGGAGGRTDGGVANACGLLESCKIFSHILRYLLSWCWKKYSKSHFNIASIPWCHVCFLINSRAMKRRRKITTKNTPWCYGSKYHFLMPTSYLRK